MDNLTQRAKKIFLNAATFLPELKTKTMQQGIMLLQNNFCHKAYDSIAPLAKIVERWLKTDIMNYEFHLAVLWDPAKIDPTKAWKEIQRLQRLQARYSDDARLYYEMGFAFAVLGMSVSSLTLENLHKATGLNPDYKSALNGMKLIQNDRRTYQSLLRALVTSC